jgi:hypothetical protein
MSSRCQSVRCRYKIVGCVQRTISVGLPLLKLVPGQALYIASILRHHPRTGR